MVSKMPATQLRNRQQQQQQTNSQNGNSSKRPQTSNGIASYEFESQKKHNQTSDELAMRKKELLEMAANADTNNNDENSFQPTEESFADASTLTRHPASKGPAQEEPIVVFSESARDQFASALLRLQSDLDSTTRRLSAIEAKLDSIAREASSKQQQAPTGKPSSTPGGFFKGNNLVKIAYLGWPVLVFLAMRALERRRALAATASN